MKNVRSAAAIAVAACLMAACQDLNIDDTTRPSVDEALGSIFNLERTVGTSSRYMFGGLPMGQSVTFRGTTNEATFTPALEGLNDAITFGQRSVNLPVTTVLDEPRTAMDHRPASFTVNKSPYNDAYAAITSCHDVRRTIFTEGWRDFVFPAWRRSSYYCKFMQGFAYLYLGTMFDKAIIVPDDLKPIDRDAKTFVPHDSVVEYAKSLIRDGIREALDTSGSMGILSTWLGNPYTNVDMAKIAYGYLARAEVWKAATPEQRKDVSEGGLVDWNKVIQYVDSSLGSTWTAGTSSQNMPTNNPGGLTLQNLTMQGSGTITATRNASLYNLIYSDPLDYFRLHHKFLGPGDTTGAYVAYLSTPIASRKDTVYGSPDKRFPIKERPRHVVLPTNSPNLVQNAITPGDGNYFQLLASSGLGNLKLASSGVPTPDYRQSSYQFIRFGTLPAAKRTVVSVSSVVYVEDNPIMTIDELRLLKAEAYMRTNRAALAVPLINVTRQAAAKGALPAAVVTGPAEGLPRCVPRSFADARVCGNLWDVLLYEKRMEALGTDPFVNFADWRAFGYLEPGSVVYFPPSFRDTEAMGYPYYTYGGDLPGSAHATAPCPTTGFASIGCTNYTTTQGAVLRQPRPPQ